MHHAVPCTASSIMHHALRVFSVEKWEFAWEFSQLVNSRAPVKREQRVAWELTGYYRARSENSHQLSSKLMRVDECIMSVTLINCHLDAASCIKLSAYFVLAGRARGQKMCPHAWPCKLKWAFLTKLHGCTINIISPHDSVFVHSCLIHCQDVRKLWIDSEIACYYETRVSGLIDDWLLRLWLIIL
jgi:hypothetical protein